MAYTQWKQHLPTTPDPLFLAFINEDTPLSKKLREQWLYQLAHNKNWTTFLQYYKDTTNPGLQCYATLALYQQNQNPEALNTAKKLWLSGHSQPIECNQLFTLLLKNHAIDERLITKRFALALAEQNVQLAFYLLQQYKPPRRQETQWLLQIHQQPKRITMLSPGGLNGELYLYGLRRMVASNMDKALQYWRLPITQRLLNHTEQQAFLAHIALYKALRNDPEAPLYFKKIEPAFYDDVLLGSQIRYALKYKQWGRIETLINHIADKDNPCWQYWRARALEATGQKEKAIALYQQLALVRHYYGFLASLRLKKSLSFTNEKAISDKQLLKPYQPFTDQIKTLYLSKQVVEASRLLNDFMSELPKDDKSALVYWISHELQWHGKSVYLSNNEELSNQLSLRFPLAYRKTVLAYAKHYQIPQELVYAVIRQESAFRDDAASTAGAQGLMQLMPTTAKLVSKREKITYLDQKQLLSSQKNINIGVAYLQQLAKRFGNHPVLMVAAYNAGPRQVAYWLKNHPPKEMDIWIETLPWQETRNYLKNVIAFYAVYQYRMQTKPDLTPFMKPFGYN